MSQLDERKALETLRSVSPTPSLIDLASETIHSCQQNCKRYSNREITVINKPEEIMDDVTMKDSFSSKSRGL